MLLTLAAFVFVLGVLIFVHEAGHFLVAKATGVQVLRFSLGFGKPLVQFKWGETEYVIAMLPFGGYVKMAGLEEEGMMGQVEGGASTVPIDPERAFDRKPLPSRIAVILAGVTMNMIFAWAVLTILAGTVGSSRTATTTIDSVFTGQLPAGAAALGTLKGGDRVVAINGDTVHSAEDIREGLALGKLPMTIQVAGRAPVVVTGLKGSEDRIAVVGAIALGVPAVLDSILPNTAASRAGFQKGDRVVSANGDSIHDWQQFTRMIRARRRQQVMVQVERNGALVALATTPTSVRDTSHGANATDSVGYLGMAPADPRVREHFAFGAALGEGWRLTKKDLHEVWTTLRMLVTHEASIRDLGGPIAIGKVSGDAARSGVPSLFEWMCLLSVNLALLNLLPIPILDGGQLVFLIAEGVRRRPLSIELRLRLTQVGFIFIVALMLFVVGNDLVRYVLH